MIYEGRKTHGGDKLYVRAGEGVVGDCKSKDQGRSNWWKKKENTGGVMPENTGERGGGGWPNAKVRGECSIANIDRSGVT